MFCQKCENQIDEGTIFCPKCGNRVTSQNTIQPNNKNKKSKHPLHKKWWFWVLIVLAALYIVGVTVGDQDSDPSTNATDPLATTQADEVIEISAEQLFLDYEENEISADKKYEGKKLKITGKINNIGKDILDDIYITLDTGHVIISVQCYFAAGEEDKVADLKTGEMITLIGKCDGKTLNIILKQCEIVE